VSPLKGGRGPLGVENVEPRHYTLNNEGSEVVCIITRRSPMYKMNRISLLLLALLKVSPTKVKIFVSSICIP